MLFKKIVSCIIDLPIDIHHFDTFVYSKMWQVVVASNYVNRLNMRSDAALMASN